MLGNGVYSWVLSETRVDRKACRLRRGIRPYRGPDSLFYERSEARLVVKRIGIGQEMVRTAAEGPETLHSWISSNSEALMGRLLYA